MFSVQLDRLRRTVRFRATGRLTLDDLKRVAEEARWCYDQFRGAPHVVLADVRGMAALSEDAGKILMDVIKYGRTNGTVCCVHISDLGIARLQAARLAREASPYDGQTIDVASLDEAERLLEEQLAKIGV
jgi:hypothetical protein